MDPAPITAEELPEFLRAVESAFHADMPPEDMALLLRVTEPERSLAVRDRGRIVAGAGIYSRRMTVPGGDVPVAAVTQVGVLPTHRRRGLLTRLMSRQLADVHEAGREAIAALWASEAVIYGRFGYGLAARHAALEVQTREARLRTHPDLEVELREPAGAVEAMRAVYDAARPARPGMLDRPGPWWDARIHDPERDREGAEPLRAAVADGLGYALYSVKAQFADGRPAGATIVRELVALTPEAGAALWGYVLGLDLVRTLNYHLAPSDDPLPHMLTNAQAVVARLGEALWVRIVDLPRALVERTYARPVRGGARGRRRDLPLERRPLGAALGRARGDLRAQLGTRRAGADRGRARGGPPRRHHAARARPRRPRARAAPRRAGAGQPRLPRRRGAVVPRGLLSYVDVSGARPSGSGSAAPAA